MPLHDWTRVGAAAFHDFHGGWITHLKEVLNDGILPSGYYAMSEQHAGPLIADVLTLRGDEKRGGPPGNGGIAVAERPPKVSMEMVPDESAAYRLARRTLAIRHSSDHRIIAMIEIVSPGNKDRPASVEEFVERVLLAFEQGYHVLLVDILSPAPATRTGCTAPSGRTSMPPATGRPRTSTSPSCRTPCGTCRTPTSNRSRPAPGSRTCPSSCSPSDTWTCRSRRRTSWPSGGCPATGGRSSSGRAGSRAARRLRRENDERAGNDRREPLGGRVAGVRGQPVRALPGPPASRRHGAGAGRRSPEPRRRGPRPVRRSRVASPSSGWTATSRASRSGDGTPTRAAGGRRRRSRNRSPTRRSSTSWPGIFAERFILCADIGGEGLPIPTVLDLALPDAILEELTGKYSAGKARLRSWTGRLDRTVDLDDLERERRA